MLGHHVSINDTEGIGYRILDRSFENVPSRFGARFGNRIHRHRLDEFDTVLFANLQGFWPERSNRGERAAAFADCAYEQASSQRRGHQQADVERARRLPEQSYPIGVATECPYVLPHPLERGYLIQQSVIAGRIRSRFLGQFRVCQETENVEPVIDSDDHNALSSEATTIEFGL